MCLLSSIFVPLAGGLRLGRIFFVHYFVKGCWREFNRLYWGRISNSETITIQVTCIDW